MQKTHFYRLIAGGMLSVVAACSTPVFAVEAKTETPAVPATIEPTPVQNNTATSATHTTDATSPTNTGATATDNATGAGAAATATTTAPAGGQTEVEQLRALVNQLTERLNKLEADQKKTAEIAAKPRVDAKLPITISGLFQVHGNSTFNESGPDSRSYDTFRLRRGEVKFMGRITPRISAYAQIDFAKIQDSNDRASDTVLQEIAINYLLSENKEKGNAHYIDVGQFKLPIGYEGDQVSSSALQTIERALMFGTRDPFRGGYGDKRETGARLRGNFGQFLYDLGVFNGLGERQNTTATRDNKAVVARLGFQPRNMQELLLGISVAKGNTGNANSDDDRLDRDVFNAFIAYQKNKVTAQAEYLTGDSSTVAGGSVRDVRSYYGSLGYKFTNKLEGVVRYDVFDFTRGSSGGDINEATLGLNYYIKGNNAKIQANLVKRSGDDLAPSGSRGDSTQLRTNFQVAF